MREHKITQYLLEVIKTNSSAIDLYKKAGFKVTREFDYYISTKNNLCLSTNKPLEDIEIKEIQYIDWEMAKTFWSFPPSWQNSIESILRKREYFRILGAFKKEVLIGYGIIEKITGDIPQLAIIEEYRRKGLATMLIKNLSKLSNSEKIKIINIDAAYIPFKELAKNINLKPGFGQYEMILDLH